jgi:hypothetical protein
MVGFRNVASQISMLVFACLLAVSPAFADSPSPTDTYLKYRAALVGAKKIEDVQSMLCKAVNEKIDHTPADMKPMMFELVKITAPLSVQVLSEAVNGDNATLIISGKTEPAGANVSEKTSGKVTLKKETGIWKIDKEAWDSKIEAGGNLQPPGK